MMNPPHPRPFGEEWVALQGRGIRSGGGEGRASRGDPGPAAPSFPSAADSAFYERDVPRPPREGAGERGRQEEAPPPQGRDAPSGLAPPPSPLHVASCSADAEGPSPRKGVLAWGGAALGGERVPSNKVAACKMAGGKNKLSGSKNRKRKLEKEESIKKLTTPIGTFFRPSTSSATRDIEEIPSRDLELTAPIAEASTHSTPALATESPSMSDIPPEATFHEDAMEDPSLWPQLVPEKLRLILIDQGPVQINNQLTLQMVIIIGHFQTLVTQKS
uniref:zinc finger CCCH domain-containing protein 18-like n=1 Tax=Podarcis muralis TaxID=64176 RepID=UPI0010A090B2|nr:zinc finger CCCH domain-containing protein 18-like [Podarcis muralis]